uniref:Uncharacterized protein n=1 Tax=Mucochytrium quahogii TaxID=96639 RepID=A0A7S2RBW0_9STRA|mmetsp:Transcript_14945/g.24342  ORF Transcript_14945/g.24342 Transcript_14945/m.24342 type:complete len:197 (-) Transcript_14945:139-729(-)|eukprot:CAMPEP_0203797454 /NCGR_PEP_ID=MMETSP0100_2-20121128/8650_1 /ASSEMBLY_ACC=CAM_ASM_000210 /TAXON_ID=96639 /ORGANISM=" , Strain NY0313808BC1" /LENGTH=196 /DNA_ID=CAMNT_0050702787 /DNA_START=55 /DNA_END=645 /DNA_ORIENTATION=-
MKAFTVLSVALALANVDLSTGKQCTCDVACFTWNQTLPMELTNFYAADVWGRDMEKSVNEFYSSEPRFHVTTSTAKVNEYKAISSVQVSSPHAPAASFSVNDCSRSPTRTWSGNVKSASVIADKFQLTVNCFDALPGTKVLGLNLTRTVVFHLPAEEHEAKAFSYIQKKIHAGGVCMGSSQSLRASAPEEPKCKCE